MPWLNAPLAQRTLVTFVTLLSAGCAGSPVVSKPATSAPPAVAARPTVAVRPGATEAVLHYTIDVLGIDATGRLFGSDCHRARLLALDASGPTVIAGSGPGEFAAGFAGDGGPATMAQFQCPIGIVVRPDGTIVFADHGNNRIREISPDGIISTIAGSGATGTGFGSFSGDGGPATNATLQEPTFLLLDSSGNLYISDRDNNRVRRLAPDGTISTVAGNGENAFGGDGGKATDAALDDPAGLAMDAKGNLYIADSNNERIRVVDPKGRIRTIAGTGTMASDGDGKQAMNASFADPEGIALGPDGTLYVAEGEGNRIRAISPGGTVSRFAGTGEVGLSGDGGPAAMARLSVGGSTGGIVLDADGNVYIPDTGNRLVRKVDRYGFITTFAMT
jgi:DNA-binding beta-propeller fold protein YncE